MSGPSQAGIEEHLRSWSAMANRDFRASSLNELVASMLGPGSVLDAGCGSGSLSALLQRRGRQVTSRDVSPAMVELTEANLAREGLSTERVRLGGVFEIAEEGVFDNVVALDVIEHIEDDVAAVAALARAMRPGGRLVLSVPALPALYGPKDEAVGHYRRYTPASLGAAVRGARLEIERMRWWNVLGVPMVWAGNRLRRRVDGGWRAGARPWHLALNAALRVWFQHVENRVEPPIGLSLLAVVRAP